MEPRIFSALAVLSLVYGCGPTPDSAALASRNECVETFEQGRDYFPTKVEVRHAQYFSVSYHGHYKVLHTQMPATNSGPGVNDRVVLVRCGTPAPELVGDLEGATVLEVPVERFATNSLASALRLRVLGLEDRIAALPQGPFDQALADLLASGRAIPLGGPGGAPMESLLFQGVDALVTFTSGEEELGAVEEARGLGLGALPLVSWAEPTYLGQAEWLKHHAVLFDAEEQAEIFFADVEARYMELADQASRRTPVRTLWASPLGSGRWWVEVGSWQEEAVRAAGGVNVFVAEPGESSVLLSTERLVQVATEVEVWITDQPSAEFLDSSLPVEEMDAWRNSQIWHVHGRSDLARGAFDWSETPLVRPDLVLEDLIAVLHPDLLPDHQLRFLRRIEPAPAGGR